MSLSRHTFPLRFGPLGPILRPALLPVRHPRRIERAPHHVIAHPGQVLDATAADEHDRVLLQIVAYTRDISSDLDPVSQPNARDLPQRRVGLLGSRGINASTDAAPLRAA